MTPLAELMNDLVRADTRLGNRTADFQRGTGGGAEDIRRQTLDVHGIV